MKAYTHASNRSLFYMTTSSSYFTSNHLTRINPTFNEWSVCLKWRVCAWVEEKHFQDLL